MVSGNISFKVGETNAIDKNNAKTNYGWLVEDTTVIFFTSRLSRPEPPFKAGYIDLAGPIDLFMPSTSIVAISLTTR